MLCGRLFALKSVKLYRIFANKSVKQYRIFAVKPPIICINLILRSFFGEKGMPAVVSEFIADNTFEGMLDIQRQLFADY